MAGNSSVREATTEDMPLVGRMLDAFNAEYGHATLGPDWVAARTAKLIAGGDTAVLLHGEEGLALLRFRDALWSEGREAYLSELYVVPERRGEGIGRALMEAVFALCRERGADTVDLNTTVDDHAALALYGKLGFTNLEGPDGPSMLYFEREL
jgi:ribosomal protein S18 acetylase RimI-like enzyme